MTPPINPRRPRPDVIAYLALILSLILVIFALLPRRWIQSIGAHALSAPDSAFYAGTASFRQKDYATARLHWQHAVDLGEARSFGTLGFLIYHGLGGPRDKPRGIVLWREGARRGISEPHNFLARAILEGDSGVGTQVEGYAHAVIGKRLAGEDSSAAGPGVARDADELIAAWRGELSPSQVKEGDSVAAAWSPSP